MNRRQHITHLISEYIDGSLPKAVADRVADHVAQCPDCAEELRQWRAILQLVARHATVPCPVDCADAVMQRLRDAGDLAPRPTGPLAAFSPRRMQAPSLAWVSALTALAALLGGGGWLALSRSPDSPVPTTVRPAPVAMPTVQAVRFDAPERLEGAFGRSDSLILASRFADDEP